MHYSPWPAAMTICVGALDIYYGRHSIWVDPIRFHEISWRYPTSLKLASEICWPTTDWTALWTSFNLFQQNYWRFHKDASHSLLVCPISVFKKDYQSSLEHRLLIYGWMDFLLHRLLCTNASVLPDWIPIILILCTIWCCWGFASCASSLPSCSCCCLPSFCSLKATNIVLAVSTIVVVWELLNLYLYLSMF